MTLQTAETKVLNEHIIQTPDGDRQTLIDGRVGDQLIFAGGGVRLVTYQSGEVKVIVNGKGHDYSSMSGDLYPGQEVDLGTLLKSADDDAFWAEIMKIAKLGTDTNLSNQVVAAISPIGYARMYRLLGGAEGLQASKRSQVPSEVYSFLLGINLPLQEKGTNELTYNDFANRILTILSLFQIFDDEQSVRMIHSLAKITEMDGDEGERLWHAVWSGIFDCGAAINVNASASSHPAEVKDALKRIPTEIYPEIMDLLLEGEVTSDDIEVIEIALGAVPGLLARFDKKFVDDPRILRLRTMDEINSAFEKVLKFSRIRGEHENLARQAFEYLFALSVQLSKENYPAGIFAARKGDFYSAYGENNSMNEAVATTESEVDIGRAESLIRAHAEQLGRPVATYFAGIGNGQRFEGPLVERLGSDMVGEIYATDRLNLSEQFPDSLKRRVNFRHGNFAEFDRELEGKVDVLVVAWSALNDMPKHEMVEAVKVWKRILSQDGIVIIDSPLIDGENSYDTLILSQLQSGMWKVPGMMRRSFATAEGEVESDFVMNEVEELLFMFELLGMEPKNVGKEDLKLLSEAELDSKLIALSQTGAVTESQNNPFYAAKIGEGRYANRMTIAFGRTVGESSGANRSQLVRLLLGLEDYLEK